MHYSSLHGAYISDECNFISNWLIQFRSEIWLCKWTASRRVSVEKNGVGCRQTDTVHLKRTTEILNKEIATMWCFLDLMNEMLYWAVITALQLHVDFIPIFGLNLADKESGLYVSQMDIFSGTLTLGVVERLASAGRRILSWTWFRFTSAQ